MTDDKSLVDAYASIYNKKEKEIEQVDEAIFTGAALAGKALLGAGKKFLMNKAKDAAMGMAKRGLGMLNPKREQQPQPAMASYQPEGEMVEDVAITHLDGSTTEVIDVVTPPPLGNKEEDQEALHNRLWDQVTANLTTLGEMDDTRYQVAPLEEKKKLDPVGEEDDDVDNDGDVDDSDSYIKNKRKKIAMAMGKKNGKKKDEDMKEEVVAEGGDGDPCWDSHKMVGMKKKGGKMVPNCVKKESFNVKSPVIFSKPEEKTEEPVISEEMIEKHASAISKAHKSIQR
tara:strand:+ start:58 stop:912 length:855 start_codon:yes stop_codon:yes gene_type:complete